MVKRSLGFVLIILCSTGVFAQRFNFVVFNKLPQDLQLYPRDEKNESIFKVGYGKYSSLDITNLKLEQLLST